jgi:hypothetical protein
MFKARLQSGRTRVPDLVDYKILVPRSGGGEPSPGVLTGDILFTADPAYATPYDLSVPRGPDDAPPYVAAVAQWSEEKRGGQRAGEAALREKQPHERSSSTGGGGGERREKSIGLRALMAANPRLVADADAASRRAASLADRDPLVRTARFALQLHDTPAQGSNASNRKAIAARLPQVEGWWRRAWTDAIASVAGPPPRTSSSPPKDGDGDGDATVGPRVERKVRSPPPLRAPQVDTRVFEALPLDILGEIGGYATPWDVEAIAEQLPGVGERIREAEARPRQTCGVRMRDAVEMQVREFEKSDGAGSGGGGGGGVEEKKEAATAGAFATVDDVKGEGEEDEASESISPGGSAVTRRCANGCARVGEWLFDRSTPGNGLEFAFGVVPARRAALEGVAGVDVTLYSDSLNLAPRAVAQRQRIGRNPYAEQAMSLPRFLALVSSVCARRIAAGGVYGATETIWTIGPKTTTTRVYAACRLNASVNIFPASGPSGPWRDLVQRLMCAVAAVYCDALVVNVAGRPRTAPDRLADYDTAKFLVHAWRRALSPDLPVWVRTPSHPPQPKDAAAALGIREESVLPLEEPLLRRQR